MLKENMEEKEIIKFTGITKEELEKIKSNRNWNNSYL